MHRDPRLIEQAFKGGRCRLACSLFDATGSAARQARFRPEENLSALAALTENFLAEPFSGGTRESIATTAAIDTG
jgi:hypothetical protein